MNKTTKDGTDDDRSFFRQMKKTKAPRRVDYKWKAELVVQDTESYQQVFDVKDRVEAIEGIKRGLKSMKSNAGKPAAEFFRELFAEKGISEEE